MPRKTITFTDKQDEYIQTRIASGGYTSDSEYVRDLVRKDQEGVLKMAVLEGLSSGISERNIMDIIKDETERMQADGGVLSISES
jgi:antitoxin ParD1/3/4